MKTTGMVVAVDNINSYKKYRLWYAPVEEVAEALYSEYHKMSRMEKAEHKEIYAMEIMAYKAENDDEARTLKNEEKEQKLFKVEDPYANWYILNGPAQEPRSFAEKVVYVVKDGKQVYLEVSPTEGETYEYDPNIGGVKILVKINETVPKVFTLEVQTGLNKEGKAYRIYPADNNKKEYSTFIKDPDGKIHELNSYKDDVYDRDFWEEIIDDVIPYEGFSRYDYGRMISFRNMLKMVDDNLASDAEIYLIRSSDGEVNVTYKKEDAVEFYVEMVIDKVYKAMGKPEISCLPYAKKEMGKQYRKVGLSKYAEVYNDEGKHISLKQLLEDPIFEYDMKDGILLLATKCVGPVREWQFK